MTVVSPWRGSGFVSSEIHTLGSDNMTLIFHSGVNPHSYLKVCRGLEQTPGFCEVDDSSKRNCAQKL
jgi:hypothetical protein